MFMGVKRKQNPTETSVIQRWDWTLKRMNYLWLPSRNMLNLVTILSDQNTAFENATERYHPCDKFSYSYPTSSLMGFLVQLKDTSVFCIPQAYPASFY